MNAHTIVPSYEALRLSCAAISNLLRVIRSIVYHVARTLVRAPREDKSSEEGAFDIGAYPALSQQTHLLRILLFLLFCVVGIHTENTEYLYEHN